MAMDHAEDSQAGVYHGVQQFLAQLQEPADGAPTVWIHLAGVGLSAACYVVNPMGLLTIHRTFGVETARGLGSFVSVEAENKLRFR